MTTATAQQALKRHRSMSAETQQGILNMVVGGALTAGFTYLAVWSFTMGGGWIVLGVFCCLWGLGTLSQAFYGLAQVIG